MFYWFAAPVLAAVVVLCGAFGFEASAQQPPAAKSPSPKSPSPKPAAPAPQGGAPAQAAPAAAAPATHPGPPLVLSQWMKVCAKGAETGGKTLCKVGRDGRLESGMPMVAAVLVEVDGEAKKVLQVTLPFGVFLPRGTRVVIDSDEASAVITPFLFCAGVGCLAQFEVNADFVAKLKKSQSLHLQIYSMQQTVTTFSLPLADFAKAYDGPPTDPKEIEERNKKELEQLQRQRNQQPAKPQ